MANDELLQFAQKAFIIKNNKILLIQKSDKDLVQPNRWEVPGGRKQEGETLDEHIIREVKEEVGLDILPKNVFDMWQFTLNINDKQTTVVAVARFCDLSSTTIDLTEDVIKNYKWVEINDELLNYNFMSQIRPVIERFVKNYNKNEF